MCTLARIVLDTIDSGRAGMHRKPLARQRRLMVEVLAGSKVDVFADFER